MTTRTIEIDLDIHKKIESERRDFDEPPYFALRRLLGLPEVRADHDEIPSTGRSWREGPVEVPHGSLARMSYQRGRQQFEGKFLDGKLVVNGRSFDTLSGAASSLAVTRRGENPSLNGWQYWEVKFPGADAWRSLHELRQRALGKAVF